MPLRKGWCWRVQSSKQPDVAALRFSGRYDPVNLRGDELQNGYGWGGLHTVEFIEAYKKFICASYLNSPPGFDAPNAFFP
jgi:hypothetical protein